METKDDQKPLRHFVFRCEGNAFHGQSFSENSFKKNFFIRSLQNLSLKNKGKYRFSLPESSKNSAFSFGNRYFFAFL